MADFTLKSFVESGNAYKAALMLQLCEADWEPLWVDFFKGVTRSDEYRSTNIMGEVPVLIDHTSDEFVVTQSGVILLYLAERYGKFVPASRADELEMMRWMFFDNHKLTSYTATYRFLSKFAGKAGEPETEFLKGRMLAAFKVLNQHLNGRDWVAAEQATLADLSLCGYLFWPDDFGVSWSDYPNIESWLKRIQNLNHWAAPEALLPAGPKP